MAHRISPSTWCCLFQCQAEMIVKTMFNLLFISLSVLCLNLKIQYNKDLSLYIKNTLEHWSNYVVLSWNFCMAKENICKMKREPTIWGNIFANDTSDKRLICKTHKEFNTTTHQEDKQSNYSHDSTPGRQTTQF